MKKHTIRDDFIPDDREINRAPRISGYTGSSKRMALRLLQVKAATCAVFGGVPIPNSSVTTRTATPP